MLAFAAAARMAPAAYVAEASLRPSAWKVGASLDRIRPRPDPDSGAVGSDPDTVRTPDPDASGLPDATPAGAVGDDPNPDPDPDPDTVRTPDPDASGLPDGAVLDDPPGPVEHQQMLLLELIGLHRQMRGAANNLNQAVAKLHALGAPVDELPATAEYVRKVLRSVDEATIAVGRWRPARRR